MTFTDLDTLKAELRRDEGVRLKPYTDSVGKLTIGVGRNLTDVGIQPHEAEEMLEHDIASTIGALSVKLPWFPALDPVRQRVLVNMGFMGVEKLLGFHLMLDACRRGDYETAADELLNSRYAHQVGQRATRLAAMLRTGSV